MFEHKIQGTVDLIRGTAPLTPDSVGQLNTLVEACLAQGQPRIVLDLAHVALIDSRGLEVLIDNQQKCFDLGGCMKLVAPNALCMDILTATNVVSHFEVFDSVAAAAGSFAQ